MVLFMWGDDPGVRWTLGQLRHLIGEAMHLRAEPRMEFVWITHFPLFVLNAEGRLESAHHPFTAPIADDLPLLYKPDKLLTITGLFCLKIQLLCIFANLPAKKHMKARIERFS